MNYSSFGRQPFIALVALLAGVLISCNGPEHKTPAADTARHIVQVTDTVWQAVGDTTNKEVVFFPTEHTKFRVRNANGGGSTYDLDGEIFLIARHADKRPLIIHTRQLIITVQSAYARLHIEAFASSPGEQADLMEGQLKVTKSYHSSTDNEPETLRSGDMVMINKEIDLMEKETMNSTERNAVQSKFSLVVAKALHN
jgi:hypothetical protein